MSTLLRVNFMNCENIKALLPEYKDEMLSDTVSAAVKEHLDSCQECSGFLASLRLADKLLKDTNQLQAPADFSQLVAGRIKRERGSLFDVFFGVNHNPFKAGLAVGAALLLLTVGVANIAHVGGKSAKYETYKTADTSAYASQFVINK